MISLASLDMPIEMFIETYVHKVTSRRATPCPIDTFLTYMVDSVLRPYLPPSHALYYKRFCILQSRDKVCKQKNSLRKRPLIYVKWYSEKLLAMPFPVFDLLRSTKPFQLERAALILLLAPYCFDIERDWFCSFVSQVARVLFLISFNTRPKYQRSN